MGLVAGAVGGAIGGKMTDIGIDDDFIKEVSNTIEPGHSALFLLVAEWTEDKVLSELSHFDATIIRTSLTEEEDAQLRESFGPHEE